MKDLLTKRDDASPVVLARLRRSTLGVTLAAVVLVMSACGSDDASTTTTSDAAQSTSATPAASTPSDVQAAVEKLYAGDFKLPPKSGPKAVRGKKVWFISCGQLFAACQRQTTGFEQASKALGWDLKVQDGKADFNTASSLIRQAIAARVDGIGISGFDCPNIKAALQAAKAAKVPVVNIAASDCDQDGKGERLFTASVRFRGSDRYTDYKDAWTAARVPYFVAKAGPTAKLVMVTERSYSAEQTAEKTFDTTIASMCPKCTVYKVPFTYAQVPNPATQIWTTGIQQHPDANGVAYGIDALMSLGLQTAVQRAAKKDLVVGGGEGYSFNFDLIRKGTQTFSVAIPYDWVGWGQADTLNRLLSGASASDLPDEGTGWQYVDKEHNLPAPGQPYEPPIDFKAAYEKIWNG